MFAEIVEALLSLPCSLRVQFILEREQVDAREGTTSENALLDFFFTTNKMPVRLFWLQHSMDNWQKP